MSAPLNVLNRVDTRIKHDNTRARKEFIIDAVIVQVAASILHVAVKEDFEDGLIKLHRNKNRKEYKKIKANFEQMQDHIKKLYDMLEYRDLRTIQAKVSNTAMPFIKIIENHNSDINLELLCVSILFLGLNRSRKTKMHKLLEIFKNEQFLYKGIFENVNKAINYEGSLEHELASDFVSYIKY